MMDWARAVEAREQLVLFPTRLEEAIPADHRVRVLDDILAQVDWSAWEACYERRRGQPPLQPKILASVILYGLLVRIRSSRALEEALLVRLDFRWLVEGRTIDHTTLSEFRRKHSVALQDLFVQIGVIAQQIGCLPLATLAFDGTRIRANNRKRGTRTPQELRAAQQALAAKYAELAAKIDATDRAEDAVLGDQAGHTLTDELADVQRRQQQVAAALAELTRLEKAGEEPPPRLPLTDPAARVMPNKDGGFAPNYTPTALVDADSGLVVNADVLADINEDKALIPALEKVQEQFGLDQPPAEVLADSLLATGANIAACEARGIDFYAPAKNPPVADNPALRADPSQPVAAADYDRLPQTQRKNKSNGQSLPQLDKQAFVYDEENNCYWCPAGQQLSYVKTTSEKTKGGDRRERRRYRAAVEDCAACSLRSQCVSGNAAARSINREQHEALRVAHAAKMATAVAKEKYARRSHPGERPFAVVKQQFGVRQFLLRGLAQVKQEWTWLMTAFNLNRLIGLHAQPADPSADPPD